MHTRRPEDRVLFEPSRLGPLLIPNRVVMAPLAAVLCDAEPLVRDHARLRAGVERYHQVHAPAVVPRRFLPFVHPWGPTL